MSFIEFQHVKKKYTAVKSEVEIRALDDASFSVEKGELAVILGASGAGKTTALNILGGMDSATEGEVIVDGRHVNEYKAKDLVTYRRNDVGFVFQFYNLVPNLTALEKCRAGCTDMQRFPGPGHCFGKSRACGADI